MVERSVRKSVKKLKAYVPGKGKEEAKKLGAKEIIKLASNENPLGPSPKALKMIEKRLRDASVYPDQYALEVKNALSKRLGVQNNNLIIGNGSDEIMQMAGAAFLSAGDEVIISENTFSTYEYVATLFDAQPVFVPLKNHTYDLAAMADKVTERSKLIFLCNPNNPTGTIFSGAELEGFLSVLPKGIIVVMDEAYCEYVGSKSYPNSFKYIKEGKNVIILRTFSKICGLAGLRVGYGIAKPEIIKYLNMVKLPFNVNRMAIAGAIGAMGDNAFIKKSIKLNKEGKKYLYKELKALGLKYVETEANFICFETEKPADILFMELMRKGIIVRPLTSFGMPSSIRVTVGTKKQNKKFIAALKTFLKK